MFNEYEMICPSCDSTAGIEIAIGYWTDAHLDLDCHCTHCDAKWVEHFVFSESSYEGYSYNGKEYDTDLKEIETYD